VTCCDFLLVEGPDWSDDHTLQLFDPNSGYLLGVNLTVGPELVQNFGGENAAPSSQGADLNPTVELRVGMHTNPSGSVAAVTGDMISVTASAAYLGGGMLVPVNFISRSMGSAESQACVIYSYEPTFSGKGDA